MCADIVCIGHRAIGRHRFVDVAVCDPSGVTALRQGSADHVLRAARLRSDVKWRKYGGAVRAVGGEFSAAVLERYGACSDGAQGLLHMMAGDGERDLRAGDMYFTAPSRRSYYEQHLVFACVMADACMLDMVIGVDRSGVGRDGGVGWLGGEG